MNISESDFIYHSPAGIDLLARLYVPHGEGPFPGVVGVHGGRWCDETRLTNAVLDRELSESGIVVMAIDFRMPPLAKFPLPVADINFAIRWLRSKAGDFAVNPNWIGGVGTSSGGHQILLNALTPNNPEFSKDHSAAMGEIDPRLNFVVAGWPVSDPPVRYAYAKERGMAVHIRAHDAYWADEAQMQTGSPQRLVCEKKAEYLPPLLLVQGQEDVILSPHMSEHFAAAYTAAGGQADLRVFPGVGHTFITKDPNGVASREAVRHIVEFIHRNCDRSQLN